MLHVTWQRVIFVRLKYLDKNRIVVHMSRCCQVKSHFVCAENLKYVACGKLRSITVYFNMAILMSRDLIS